MEPLPLERKTAAGRILKLIVKLIVSVFCLWYISTRVDFTQAVKALLKANWWLLGIAVLLYALSKLFSTFRLQHYFRNINLHLSHWQNIKLYWLGMFYNLFLPGAIGGDAYKVILLNKKLQAPYKKTSAAVLLDRFSGLLGLGVILAIYGVIVLENVALEAVLIGGSLLSIAGLYFVIKVLFKEFLPSFWPTFLWGFCVQATQVVSIYLILLSMGLPIQSTWIFIFLLASLVTVFPISLGGGLGTRELVFAEGARYFHLDLRTGVTISLLFFLCNLLSCVWGAYFIFRDPLPQTAVAIPTK